MKIFILSIILLSLYACAKISTEIEFTYDFSITRCEYLNDVIQDSTVFYYDNEQHLLRVDNCPYPNQCYEYYVKYESNNIKSWDGTYMKDENNRFIKKTFREEQVIYTYENGFITHEKRSFKDIMTNEEYFIYSDDNLIKDSMIYYNQNDGEKIITVYRSTYTDTLVPEFILDFSGLFEFPLKHKFLVKEKESVENGVMYKYTYEISDNELIEYAEFFDTFNNIINETLIRKYTYNKTHTTK